ncbi:MAG TPA: bifunctional adenosylcobinamide kinase/adenosylcobinamide-phosphate guanylyltransferase [Alphaproteobacteria bacterium]
MPSSSYPISLFLGGARSGKSTQAERVIAEAARARRTRPLYVATAEARDAEMQARILTHRERRGAAWDTIEQPFDLVGTLAGNAGRVILIDCLTLWLSNLMLAGCNVAAERAHLIAELTTLRGPIALISNEVGLGIVPDNALARAFRDEAGMLNQAIAAVAHKVVFMAAGLQLVMKDEPMAEPSPSGFAAR